LTYDGYSLVNSGPTGPTGRAIVNKVDSYNLEPAIGALYPSYILNVSDTDFVGMASKYVTGTDNDTPSIIFGDNNNNTNDLSFTYLNLSGSSYVPDDLLKLTYDGKLSILKTPSLNTNPFQLLVRNSSTSGNNGIVEYVNLNQESVLENSVSTPFNVSNNFIGRTILMNLSITNSVGLLTADTIDMPTGTTFRIIQQGTGQTSITGDSNNIIRSKSNWTKISNQYGLVTLTKTGATSSIPVYWNLSGDLKA
jgi:hypothetical protein